MFAFKLEWVSFFHQCLAAFTGYVYIGVSSCTFFHLCTIQTQLLVQQQPHTAASPGGPQESLSLWPLLLTEGLKG